MSIEIPVKVALYGMPPDVAFGPEGPLAVRARVIFDVLQDRHLPFTPDLARKLATFETAASPAADPYWGRAYGHAALAIGLGNKLGYRGIWKSIFPTFVQAVVEPILRTLALRTGTIDLVRITDHPVKDADDDYRAACRTVETWVNSALSKKDVIGEDFWIAAGAALLGAFRKQGPGKKANRGGDDLPWVPDLQMAQLIYGFDPVIEDNQLWRKKPPRPSARSKKLRVGIRPREGGVTGVLHSRRIRDIPDALPSAFVLPQEYRLLKLIEEGFMIPHRPPRRRPDRDLLSLTMQSRAVEGLEAADIIKAAWTDAAIRLRILLTNMAMTKSEIGYGQIRETGAMAAALSFGSEAPKARFDPQALKEGLRRNAFSISTLFPDILDTYPTPQKTRISTDARAPEVAAIDMLMRTCAARAASAQPKGIKIKPQSKVDDYARTFLMEIAPGVIRGDEIVVLDWRQDRRAMVRRYGFERPDGMHCATILCPPDLRIGATFRLCADDTAEVQELAIAQLDNPRETLAGIIGALSSWIMTQNVLAAAHG